MSRFSIVGLSGSPSEASSTRRLVDQTVERIGAQARADIRIVDIADLDGLAVRSRQDAGRQLEGALRAVETADLIIAGSPSTRAPIPASSSISSISSTTRR